MKMNDVFPSNYLKASEIPEGTMVPLRIDRVEIEEFGQGKEKESKPVVYFVGKEKGLVLNKTNWQSISYVHGDESDDWHGKPVQLFRDMTTFGGKPVECLRIKAMRSPNGNNGGQGSPVAASMASRGQEIRNRAPAEPPFGDESEIDPASIPF